MEASDRHVDSDEQLDCITADIMPANMTTKGSQSPIGTGN